MITIIADPHGYTLPPADAVIATKTDDYIQIRRRIRIALDKDEQLIVFATNPVLLGWLRDLQRYPESHVTWRTIDPSEAFTRLFGVAPTEPFTPTLIAALQIHDLPQLPTGKFVHPLTWILGHRLDPLWQYDIPPLDHIFVLAEWALNQPAPPSPEIATLVQAQLERWSVNQSIYRALHGTNLANDSANLLLRWALQRYETVWRNNQVWGKLPIPDGIPSPTVLLPILHKHHDGIRAYWNRQMAGVSINAKFIDVALEHMSGLSKAELDALTMMLDQHPEALSRQLLQRISSRFAHLPNTQHTLDRFEEMVPPPAPILPEADWSMERWFRWATQEYMPYYAWVIQGDHDREHQQACAFLYSDWLYSQYPSWLNDEQSPLILRQYQEMYELVEGDSQTMFVWLIIDGMTWWQGILMREICVQYGLQPHSHTPGIAILPSITSVSKRALVTGQPTIDLIQPTIAAAARVKLARSNVPAIVSYDLPESIKAIGRDDGIRGAIVLFNMIDILAHQTSTFTNNAGIRGYLEDLASQLSSAQQVCAAQGRKLHVLIGSDHGSTLLPKDAANVPLPNMVREIDDVWEPEVPGQENQKPGTRAAATDLQHMPSVDQKTWYILDRDRFQLDRHYLVPRGYGYIKRRPSGWTHGGLTPEETIVPLIHFAPEQPQVIPIEVLFRGTLNAGQAGTIVAVLRNLNPFPVQELLLTVNDATNEAKAHQLGALGEHTVTLSFAEVRVPGSELLIDYKLSYNVFGNPNQHTGQAFIEVRRLQTKDTSFEDLFN